MHTSCGLSSPVTAPYGLLKKGRALPSPETWARRGNPWTEAAKCIFINNSRGTEVSENRWTASCSAGSSGLLVVFPTHIASEKKGLGTGTSRDLHVLCYQHHKEMVPKLRAETSEQPLYACQEADCLVCYDATVGYFLDTGDLKILEQEIRPRIRCSRDGRFMYLGEVRPEQRSFRLWRCPECDASYTNQQSEKKAGA